VLSSCGPGTRVPSTVVDVAADLKELLICYVFHRLVERRFVNTHQRAVVTHTAAVEPKVRPNAVAWAGAVVEPTSHPGRIRGRWRARPSGMLM